MPVSVWDQTARPLGINSIDRMFKHFADSFPLVYIVLRPFPHHFFSSYIYLPSLYSKLDIDLRTPNDSTMSSLDNCSCRDDNLVSGVEHASVWGLRSKGLLAPEHLCLTEALATKLAVDALDNYQK